MATLNANTVVVKPGTLDVVVLDAGTQVPEWASDLIGAHLLDDGALAADAETEVTVTIPEGVPDGSWKVDDLRAYAKAHDVNLEGATSKADILKQLGV